jgi:hypothetical protein
MHEGLPALEIGAFWLGLGEEGDICWQALVPAESLPFDFIMVGYMVRSSISPAAVPGMRI